MKKFSVVSTRLAAASRVTQPRSAPMPYAVSPKPTAAMLENDFVGQRSGTSPFFGLVVSQNHWNVSRSTRSISAVSAADATYVEAVSAAGAVAVPGGAGAQAERRRKRRVACATLL